ncbi:MAG TPA: HPr family phosphocarrier protein [Firmicutes bacterium]|nr:HPr family phosphocarrier protein [Bacillota bacterium]
MVSKTVQVINPMGMHMRPAQLFIKTITPFACDVTILANGQEINAKSIMNLMAACIKQGTEIEIQCNGADEEAALKAAVELVESGLGE